MDDDAKIRAWAADLCGFRLFWYDDMGMQFVVPPDDDRDFGGEYVRLNWSALNRAILVTGDEIDDDPVPDPLNNAADDYAVLCAVRERWTQQQLGDFDEQMERQWAARAGDWHRWLGYRVGDYARAAYATQQSS